MPAYIITVNVTHNIEVEADSDLHAQSKMESIVARIEENAKERTTVRGSFKLKGGEIFTGE